MTGIVRQKKSGKTTTKKQNENRKTNEKLQRKTTDKFEKEIKKKILGTRICWFFSLIQILQFFFVEIEKQIKENIFEIEFFL